MRLKSFHSAIVSGKRKLARPLMTSLKFPGIDADGSASLLGSERNLTEI